MELIDEVVSSHDEADLPEPQEIDEAIAKRVTKPKVEPVVVSEPLYEDLELEGGGSFVSKIIPIEDSEWPKRMDDYSYSSRQRLFITRGLQKKADYLDQKKSHSEWKPLGGDAKSGVTMWSRDSERGLTCLKSQGNLDFTPRQVFLTLAGGMKYRVMYDKNVEDGFCFEKVTVNTYVQYQAARKIPLVSQRDFIIVNHMVQVSSLTSH